MERRPPSESGEPDRAAASSEAVLGLAADGQQVLYWNESAGALWGEERLQAGLNSLLAGDAAALEEIRASGQAGASELALVRLDGTTWGSRWELTPLSRGDGKAIAWLARVRWEGTLAEGEDRYRQLAELSSEAVLVLQHERVVYLNRAAALLLGAARAEDVTGRSIRELVMGESFESIARELHACAQAGGRIPPFEAALKGVDGAPLDVEIAAAAVSFHGQGAVQVVARDVASRRRAAEQLREAATSDPLTGLPNRLRFNERVAEAIRMARAEEAGLAVLVLNVDRFKVINDTLGHAVGDLLLKAISERLGSCLRREDLIARLGGDEFTLMVPGATTSLEAVRLCRRIFEVMARPFWVEGQELFVGASLGVAMYPEDGEDPGLLTKNADTAMYRAKEFGNTYQLYTASMSESSLERLEMERHLHRALERDEFVLHYQPQVDVATGRIVGAEALIRWQHSELGMVPPGKFIPLAEETGLILPITHWVLKTACAQARAWLDQGLLPLRVAINLSGLFFRHPGIVTAVHQALLEHHLPPETLDLELTESIFMEDREATLATLHALREMGVSISIDDFGTGYSSLNYLKRFPIGMLKIDQSFVRDLTVDADDAAIVRTIILLAHSLNMRAIAEGVETQEQRAYLAELHCDEIQGYHVARPLSAEAFAQRLASDQADARWA